MSLKLITRMMLCASLCVASQTLLAGDTGSVLKNDTLRAKPFSDAAIQGTVQRGENISILSSQNGWLEIKGAKKQGWVRILSVKRNVPATNNQGVLALNSGRAGTGKIVATTGVRGLSSEELKSAQYSAEQIALLATYQTSAEQARQVALGKGLTDVNFADLAKPK